MICVLRIGGRGLEERRASVALGLTPCRTYEHDGDTCFNFEIAEADDRPLLLKLVNEFLRDNEAGFRDLNRNQNISSKVLDVGVAFGADQVALSVKLDEELVDRAAKLGLGIEVSVYKTSVA